MALQRYTSPINEVYVCVAVWFAYATSPLDKSIQVSSYVTNFITVFFIGFLFHNTMRVPWLFDRGYVQKKKKKNGPAESARAQVCEIRQKSVRYGSAESNRNKNRRKETWGQTG